MLSIQKNIPMPQAKRGRPKTGTQAQRAIIARFKAAYKALYNVEPTVTFDGTWCSIVGQKERVKLKRLKELTQMMKYRADS